MEGLEAMYFLVWSSHERVVEGGTTERIIATPVSRWASRKDWGGLERAEKSMEGMEALPRDLVRGTAVERWTRSRWKEAVRASSWPVAKDDLMSAYMEGSMALSVPDREANAEEISPSFLGEDSMATAALARPRCEMWDVSARGRAR